MSVLEIMNLWMVPAISVAIFYHRSGRTPVASAQLLLNYLIFAVCSIPVSHVGTVVVKRLLHRTVKTDSVFYTVIAIVVAVILPYAAEIWKKGFPIRLEIEKKD